MCYNLLSEVIRMNHGVRRIIVHIGSILIILVEIVIEIALDLIPFHEIKSLKELLSCPYAWVVIISIGVLIVFNVLAYQKDSGKKQRNSKLNKAMNDNGFYDTVSDEMKKCVADHDLENFRKIIKMAKMAQDIENN